MLAFPVPNFQMAVVSMYPLSVVELSAVCTNFGGAASSATAKPARLTKPTLNRPCVHFFMFIVCSFDGFFVLLIAFFCALERTGFAQDGRARRMPASFVCRPSTSCFHRRGNSDEPRDAFARRQFLRVHEDSLVASKTIQGHHFRKINFGPRIFHK